MNKDYKRVYIGSNFARLLTYIVKYRKIRGKANAKLVVEQVLLAYAKQIVSGMPEPVWRANMLTLINECEQEHKEYYESETAKYKEAERRASQSPPGHKTLLRRTTGRKVYKGKSEEAN